MLGVGRVLREKEEKGQKAEAKDLRREMLGVYVPPSVSVDDLDFPVYGRWMREESGDDADVFLVHVWIGISISPDGIYSTAAEPFLYAGRTSTSGHGRREGQGQGRGDYESAVYCSGATDWGELEAGHGSDLKEGINGNADSTSRGFEY